MTIFVGSTNPVKTNSVIAAASETWPEVKVVGYETQSGISEQPIGDQETRTGANNRAESALKQGLLENPELDQSQILGVGLEGGVFDIGQELWSTVWICVIDSQGNKHESNGARFKVPEIVASQIKSGGEMGPIISEIVGEADVRKKQGMIGVITGGFVDRTEEYTGIVKMALGLWYGRNWQAGLKNSDLRK